MQYKQCDTGYKRTWNTTTRYSLKVFLRLDTTYQLIYHKTWHGKVNFGLSFARYDHNLGRTAAPNPYNKDK